MQQVISLTKDNVMSITVEYGKPTDFHGIQMKFFKRPIIYSFQEPVKIQRSTYSLLISDINSNDKNILNLLFKRMEPSISIKDTVFVNYNDSKGTVFEKSEKYMIQVEIQGFKKNGDNITSINRKLISPIWKIREIL